jgi:hypothetical protein
VPLTRWIYKSLVLHYLVCRAYLETTATPCVNKTLPFNANTQNALAPSNNFFLSYVKFILLTKKPYTTQRSNCCVRAIHRPRPKNLFIPEVPILEKTITSR